MVKWEIPVPVQKSRHLWGFQCDLIKPPSLKVRNEKIKPRKVYALPVSSPILIIPYTNVLSAFWQDSNGISIDTAWTGVGKSSHSSLLLISWIIILKIKVDFWKSKFQRSLAIRMVKILGHPVHFSGCFRNFYTI